MTVGSCSSSLLPTTIPSKGTISLPPSSSTETTKDDRRDTTPPHTDPSDSTTGSVGSTNDRSTTDPLETDRLLPSTTEGGPTLPLNNDGSNEVVAGLISFAVFVTVTLTIMGTVVTVTYVYLNKLARRNGHSTTTTPYYSEVRDPRSLHIDSLDDNYAYEPTSTGMEMTNRRNSTLNAAEVNDTNDALPHTTDLVGAQVVNPTHRVIDDIGDDGITLKPNPSYTKKTFGMDSANNNIIPMEPNESYKKTLFQ